MKIFVSILAIVFFINCTRKEKRETKLYVKQFETTFNKQAYLNLKKLPVNGIWSNDPSYLIDSLMPLHEKIIRYYFTKYDKDTCYPIPTSKEGWKESFNLINSIGDSKYDKYKSSSHYNGIVKIGDINFDGKPDSIFVLGGLNFCDENHGDAYYFTDTSLPRLQSESSCCHPENVFIVGDIDEDGIAEIGQWSSSCLGRTKALIVWSLKNHEWKQIGTCGIMGGDFEQKNKRIKKTGKAKFEMLQILSEVNNYEHPTVKWLKFTM